MVCALSHWHLSKRCDNAWVHLPCGWIPDARLHVRESLYTCVMSVFFYLIWCYTEKAS